MSCIYTLGIKNQARLAGRYFAFKALTEFRFSLWVKASSTWRHNSTCHLLQQPAKCRWCIKAAGKHCSQLAKNRKLLWVSPVMQLKGLYSFLHKTLLGAYRRFNLQSWRCVDNSTIFQKRHIQWHWLEKRDCSALPQTKSSSKAQNRLSPAPQSWKSRIPETCIAVDPPGKGRGWSSSQAIKQEGSSSCTTLLPVAGRVLPTQRSGDLLEMRGERIPSKVKRPLMQPTLTADWLDRRKSADRTNVCVYGSEKEDCQSTAPSAVMVSTEKRPYCWNGCVLLPDSP